MENGSGAAEVAGSLKPRRISETISEALEVYKRNWQTLILLVAIVAVPVSLVQHFIIKELVLSVESVDFTTVDTLSELNEAAGGGFYRSLWASSVGNLFIFVMTYVLMAAVTKAAADDIVGRTPSIGDSYAFGFRKFFSVLWISILVGLIVVGGLILLIIPGLIFAVKLAVSIPPLVVEDRRGTRAIGKSWELTRGHFWHVLGAILLAAIITGVVSALITGPFDQWLVAGILGGIAMSITMPFSILVSVLIYIDLRVRKENLDVATLRSELERQSAA